MKTLMTVLMLVSANAFAAPEFIEVNCHSAGVADGGYQVMVTRSIEGKLSASLFEQSFRGTELIAKGRVQKTSTNTKDIYRNLDFKLAINTTPIVVGEYTYYRGKISGSVLPSEEYTEMNCEVNTLVEELPNIHPPRFTCQAYFSGAMYDADKNRCVQVGASGCSNPFEFENVADCEDAFTFAAVRR